MTVKIARPVYSELYDEVGSVYRDPDTRIKFDCWAVEDLDEYDCMELKELHAKTVKARALLLECCVVAQRLEDSAPSDLSHSMLAQMIPNKFHNASHELAWVEAALLDILDDVTSS